MKYGVTNNDVQPDITSPPFSFHEQKNKKWDGSWSKACVSWIAPTEFTRVSINGQVGTSQNQHESFQSATDTDTQSSASSSRAIDKSDNLSVSEQSVSLLVNDTRVSMRTNNGNMDASKIFAISSVSESEQKPLRDHIIRKTGGLYRESDDIPITYGHSKLLSNYLGVSHKLERLFKYGDEHLGLPQVLPTDSLSMYLEIFEVLRTGLHRVSIRRRDLWVNASHILAAAGFVRNVGRMIKKCIGKRVDGRIEYIRNVPRAHQGLYVSLNDGIALCKRYGLSALIENLSDLTPDGKAEPLCHEIL